MPVQTRLIKELDNVMWRVPVRHVHEMHTEAMRAFHAGELAAYDIAEDFLDKIWSKMQHDAFQLTHNQIRMLCKFAGRDTIDYLYIETPYEIPKGPAR